RPHAHTVDGGAALDILHALVDHFVRVLDGVPEPRDAHVIAGGIDHRTEVVEVRRQLLDALADVGVVFVERGVAEDVGGNEYPQRPELTARLAQETGDGRQPRFLVVWPRVLRGAQLAVGREADIVELDLVEPLAGRFLRDGDVVAPDLLAERVDPGELLVVDPGPAGARVDDGEVGPAVGENVVFEGHDAADGVDAARFQIGHEAVEVLEGAGALGADRQRQRHLGTVDDPAAVALHVDHDRVQFGPSGQVEDAAADAPVTDAEIRQVRRLDDLRLHDQLDCVAGRRQLHLREAGLLHHHGCVARMTLDGEPSFGVRQVLDATDDDRYALERAVVGVKDLTSDRFRPGDARRLGGTLDRPP